MTYYVYVLGDQGGPWKVGYSRNPAARARDVLRLWPGNQMASPQAQIMAVQAFSDRQSAHRAEKEVHNSLHRFRCPKLSRVLSSVAPNALEWFDVDLQIVQEALARQAQGESVQAIADSHKVSKGGLKKALDRHHKRKRMEDSAHGRG